MPTLIADTACVDPRAEIADDVEIGPYCIVGPYVQIGKGTRLLAHVYLSGHTTLGQGNVLSPFCAVGGDPQHLADQGAQTRLEIGDHNIIREGATINRGTEKGEGVTRIGSHNLLMAHAHVAHDCQLGDRITLANNALLGGHVHVESHATISGGVAVHHYVTIGDHSFVAGQSRIYHDVPRYMLVDGNPSRVRCINVVGLKRHGFSRETIEALHEAHRLLYRAKMDPRPAAEILKSHHHLTVEVQRLVDFLEAQRDGRHGRARERGRVS